MGWGALMILAGAGVAMFSQFSGLALSPGPQFAMLSGGAMLALIGATLLTTVTTVFDRQSGSLTWTRRVLVFTRRREARLDEVHEVVLQSSRDESGRSYRAAVSLRGQIWPLADTYRDRAGAEKLVLAADRFFNGAQPGSDGGSSA